MTRHDRSRSTPPGPPSPSRSTAARRCAPHTAIIATGVSWRRVPIEGFDRFVGKGVYYGTARTEARIAQGADVHLIGAGNSAGQAAMFIANHARSVTLVVRGDSLEKSMSQYLIDQIRRKSNIRVRLNSQVSGVHGDAGLSEVDLLDAATGTTTHRNLRRGLRLHRRRRRNRLAAGRSRARPARLHPHRHEPPERDGPLDRDATPTFSRRAFPASSPCGDVRFGPVKRVAAAVGEGSMAIAFVHQYLSTLPKRAAQA